MKMFVKKYVWSKRWKVMQWKRVKLRRTWKVNGMMKKRVWRWNVGHNSRHCTFVGIGICSIAEVQKLGCSLKNRNKTRHEKDDEMPQTTTHSQIIYLFIYEMVELLLLYLPCFLVEFWFIAHFNSNHIHTHKHMHSILICEFEIRK